MGQRIYIDNGYTRLTVALAAGDLTANVTAGDGVKFVLAAAGDWIIATLAQVSGYKEIAWEIVKITARATDALTIVRAQEGSSALAFSIGDSLDCRMTAMLQKDTMGRLTKAMPSDANYTLTETEYHNKSINIVGGTTLTVTRNIVLPLDEKMYHVYNGSAGAHDLQFIGASGTGVAVTNGSRCIIECDGTNFNRVTPDVS